MKAPSDAMARPARSKTAKASESRPKMTRRLAEERAVGDPAKPKFDGAALLQILKK
jgi:hypothetical protein